MKYRFLTKASIMLASLFTITLVCAAILSAGNVAYPQISSNSSSPSLLSGIISSLLLDISPYTENSTNDSTYTNPFNITNIPKFILAGDWNIRLSNSSGSNTTNNNFTGNLKVIDITADFVGITTDGKGSHSHQISNFTPLTKKYATTDKSNNGSSGSGNGNTSLSALPIANVLSLNGNAGILGTVDVGINNNIIWKDVQTNITVSNGKTIEIQLDDRAIDYHFGKGQSIFGLVNGLYLPR